MGLFKSVPKHLRASAAHQWLIERADALGVLQAPLTLSLWQDAAALEVEKCDGSADGTSYDCWKVVPDGFRYKTQTKYATEAWNYVGLVMAAAAGMGYPDGNSWAEHAYAKVAAVGGIPLRHLYIMPPPLDDPEPARLLDQVKEALTGEGGPGTEDFQLGSWTKDNALWLAPTVVAGTTLAYLLVRYRPKGSKPYSND